MKKILVIILSVVLLLHSTKAQNKRMIFSQYSLNQIEIGFEHNVFNERLVAQICAGVGNQDINSGFNDFTSRLGIGYKVIADPKNQFSIHTGIGLYFPNNDYYSITVPLVNTGLRYTRFLGKTQNNGVFIDAGYRYGKRDYQQAYVSETAFVSTIGTFEIAPLNFSIGYGFTF